MTPLPWAMVPTGFWSLPVVQEAGHDAAVVVLTLLLDAGGRGAECALPEECLRPKRIAVATGLAMRDGLAAAVERVEAAMVDAFTGGLLTRADDGSVWFGPGLWVDRRDVRRKLRADEVRQKRKTPASSEHGAPEPAHGVSTVCAQPAHGVRQREEERREEIPPVVPPGGPPAEEGIDDATLTRWRQAVGAGAVETSRQGLALTAAWDTYGATITREAVAAALDWSVQAGGRAFRPEWLDERCAKLKAAKVREAATAEPPRGVQPVLDAFDGNRGHPLTAHQRAQVVDALKAETPSTLAAIAVQVGGAGPVRVPASWLAAVLPEARAKAAAEDAARERYAEADRARAEEADAFRERLKDPAYLAERMVNAARLKAAVAEMGGDE